MQLSAKGLIQMPLREYVRLAANKCYLVPVAKVCNAACIFCATDEYRPEVDREFMLLAGLDAITERLYGAGVRRFEVTGGGEPTLHPQLSSILACIGRLPDAYIKLYTNGSRPIESCHVSELNISRCVVDADKNQKLMRIKGGSPLLPDAVIEARRMGYRRIRLSVPLISGGVESLSDAVEFVNLMAEYVDEIVFRPLYPATPSRHGVSPELVDLPIWQDALNSLESSTASTCAVEVDVDGCFRAAQLILASDSMLYGDWSMKARIPW